MFIVLFLTTPVSVFRKMVSLFSRFWTLVVSWISVTVEKAHCVWTRCWCGLRRNWQEGGENLTRGVGESRGADLPEESIVAARTRNKDMGGKITPVMGFSMPVAPSSMGSCMYYICDSYALGSLEGLSTVPGRKKGGLLGEVGGRDGQGRESEGAMLLGGWWA